MTLFLVRHGLVAADPGLPPEQWPLDPAGFDAIHALRVSGRVPSDVTWFSSPETKARDTAARLTDGPVDVVDDLAEHRRGRHWMESQEVFRAAVRRAFEAPEERVVPEWEPLADTRERVVGAVRRLLESPGGDLVLVGHGTAWTLLVSALSGRPPDLDAWERLSMPDLWVVDTPTS